MGFGHRIYKKLRSSRQDHQRTAELVFDVTGETRSSTSRLELELIALEDEYFVSRKLYPNWTSTRGFIYEA